MILPSSTVTDRSAVGVVSVSVALLLVRSVSVVPAGGATETVLVSEPLADGLIWPVAVKVALPPGSKVTVAAMLPVPLDAAPLAPPEAGAVQLPLVMSAGNTSVPAAPAAVLGPLLVTVIV